MFLFRIVFWLAVVVMLLPTGIVGAISAAADKLRPKEQPA